jgi:hypothetical protein
MGIRLKEAFNLPDWYARSRRAEGKKYEKEMAAGGLSVSCTPFLFSGVFSFVGGSHL